MPATRTSDLVGVLRAHADRTPDALACGFLTDGERETVSLTYAELEIRARGLSAQLLARMAPGSRALLAYEPGLEFVVAFFACMFAGIVAVPVPPPAAQRSGLGLSRLEHVRQDAGAEAVLTTRRLRQLVQGAPAVATGTTPWIATDEQRGDPATWRDRGDRARHVAFIQYSSGSTSRPRGVAITHANLLANQRAIAWALGIPDHATVVTWLPMHHDMGLIGTMLQPVYRGAPCYLMSPLHFLRRPVQWLAAISRFGGVMCGGPSFAYELCVRRVSQTDSAPLDLSSWQVAFCGAEPIRPATVRAFQRRFAPHGFRVASLVGCYGLAEATLLATGARSHEPKFHTVDRRDLERGRARPVPPDAPGAVELASSGRPPPDHELLVVDPRTRRPLGPDRVGEIWFRGPSVGQGYWGRQQETAGTFQARTHDRSRTYLRTGDLGFLHDGRLHVTGRLSDVLIVRGRNVHPHDIEDTVQRIDPRLRSGRGVAFGVERDGEERVVLAQEVALGAAGELDRLAATVRRVVLDEHDIALFGIALVAPRSVLKTSSGKPRRRATGEALLSGRMRVLHGDEWLTRPATPVSGGS